MTLKDWETMEYSYQMGCYSIVPISGELVDYDYVRYISPDGMIMWMQSNEACVLPSDGDN